MAFPITHMLVAERILESYPSTEMFVLGSVAPDAVHYRNSLLNAPKSELGPAKKITHLCPINDEKWGYVTDNEGWIECVRLFLRQNDSPLAIGYAVHVLTDCFNNKGLWRSFREDFPQEAAKGYKSGYYRDLQEIDLKLYLSRFKGGKIERLLADAKPSDMPALVSAAEINAIRDNILYENYNGRRANFSHKYEFISHDETLKFIDEAADFICGLKD